MSSNKKMRDNGFTDKNPSNTYLAPQIAQLKNTKLFPKSHKSQSLDPHFVHLNGAPLENLPKLRQQALGNTVMIAQNAKTKNSFVRCRQFELTNQRLVAQDASRSAARSVSSLESSRSSRASSVGCLHLRPQRIGWKDASAARWRSPYL